MTLESEAKISSLLRNARKRVQKESSDGWQRWWQAERDLRKEDHYLGVMVAQSRQSTGDFWPVMKWAGITMVVVSAALYLETKGWMPKWIEELSPRLDVRWSSLRVHRYLPAKFNLSRGWIFFSKRSRE